MVTYNPRGQRATGPNQFLLYPVERDTSGRHDMRIISYQQDRTNVKFTWTVCQNDRVTDYETSQLQLQ
jgi:hypothetical protein